jgi:hypothetical protein
MGIIQSRVQGIQRLHASGASCRDVARTLQRSHTTIADAIHSDMPPSPAIKRGRRPMITRLTQIFVHSLASRTSSSSHMSVAWGTNKLAFHSCSVSSSSRDRLVVKHRANWLIRDAENAFLQHRLTLPPIEEILSIEAGLGRRGRSESPFDPQQFFAGRSFELSIE